MDVEAFFRLLSELSISEQLLEDYYKKKTGGLL
jgi:hypothetical protein